MEKRLDTDSCEILGDWDFLAPVDPQGITMVSVPASPESEDAISNPHKEVETRVSTSKDAGEGKEEEARRVMPPWMEPSYEWGGGKWKEDGRKKKKEKESEEIIPFKEIIESLLRNSGEKVEEEEEEEEDEEEKGKKSQSCVEMLKSMGFKFP